jgi:hypothetical protein
MLGTWLGRVVAVGVVAGVLAACSSSSKDTGGNGSGDDDTTDKDAGPGTGDASTVVDSGSDASPNNRVTNDAGECVSNCHEGDKCTMPTQCASGICTNDACVEPSCTDGMLDGTETAPDCGGTCSACADGLGCVIGGDCESGVCDPSSKTCAVPTSTDTVKNGNETGVDCGSSGTGTNTNAPPCGDGQGCNDAGDCANKLCSPVTNTCTPSSCTDKIQNGTETGLDCGGLCNPCADGIGCKVDADCTSKSCDINGTHLCLVPTDTDMITNGNETDVDCGSSGTNDGGEKTNAPTCGDGEMCNVGGDCTDGVCDPTAKTCSAPSCTDKVQNGGETGVDCGDSIITLCPACGDGVACKANSDCTSLNCDTTTTHKCLAPTDTDKIQNGNESDVDCGSSGSGENTHAPACPDINATTKAISVCSAGADCKSGYCNATEKQCVDGQSCSLPAKASAAAIQDIKTQATATTDATGTPNTNGAGLYAGIDTCGQGEATDPPAIRKLESCCKSLDATVPGEGNVRIDKYEVTSGRMRQFIEYVNAQEGDYDLQKYVLAQFNADGTPKTGNAFASTLYGQIPTPSAKAGSTDTRYLYPTSEHGVLNMVQQLGGTSVDTGIPSDLQGCYVGLGNSGSSTYWWPADGEAVVGSPPRSFTQDYYDIKPLNCAMYWMAAAFCAWDGGRLASAADDTFLWGAQAGVTPVTSNNYPWGSDNRNWQAKGGLSAYTAANNASPNGIAITDWTVDNLNDTGGGNFYFYPTNSNQYLINIPDTIDNGADYSPYIASPGRFLLDASLASATAGSVYANDNWYDVAANLFEYRAIPATSFNGGGILCDTTQNVLTNPNANSTTSCPTTDPYGVKGTQCVRANYKGLYECGFVRGSGDPTAPVSKMPSAGWEGGSWEVHGIPVGNYGLYGSFQMNTQYGKAGFRCARNAE